MITLSKINLEKNLHRKIIGYLGLFLPFGLYLGNAFFGCTEIQNSISHYYHTFMRDVLVGTIVLISLFFLIYKVYDNDLIPFRIAGISILIVAFFPTSIDPEVANYCQEFTNTNRDFSISKYIHYGAAIIFFIVLTYICLFLFTNTSYDKPKYKEQYWRNFIIRICGFLMLFVVLFLTASALLNFNQHIGDINLLFWGESVAIIAFSIAWLVKGRFISILENKTLL